MTKPVLGRLAAAASVVVALAAYPFSASRPHQSDMIPAIADSVLGVFEGRTPCGPVAVEFTRFPSQGCEKIKWQLTLYRHAGTGSPTTFLYEGTRTVRRGTWRIGRGTAFDSRAEVFHLTPIPAGEALLLLNVASNVLLLLDSDRRVLVGDASWSYVLNRTNRK